mmetsp:Transcript_39351/g.113919  ORF Transcript_39351/g.113919 Transcript_39351/m.113919 type:complete len:773 (-) Transcript_39351:4-2322(-)
MLTRLILFVTAISLLATFAWFAVRARNAAHEPPPLHIGARRVASDPGAVQSEPFPARNENSTRVSSSYDAALHAFRAGEFSRVSDALRGCEDDDAGCLTLRAEQLLVGAGVERNPPEALRLFHAAADLGFADAQYALGVLYANDLEQNGRADGFRRKDAISLIFMYAASVAGHLGAQMAMGYRYSQGYGVSKSCATAALNYVEVARKVAEVYSAGMPQAVELVRLGVDGGDKKSMTASEVSLFVEIAASGDASIAAAVGKRYMLGIEGFRQNYQKAAQHLQIAADKNHGGAMALLGYMHCLGLGVPKNMDAAHSYFMSSALQDDALGHNGLGYIYFHGASSQERDLTRAFKHFNASAYGGSADGMFNLASLYLTGTGVGRSFQRAALWYTQALDRGHTPAAYTLAIMHLNGIGTVRNCKLAVDLLKRVCERGAWVSEKLQEAYDRHREGNGDVAAWLFLRLAEAGHEVAQMNLAHLLDSGAATWLLPPVRAGVGKVERVVAVSDGLFADMGTIHGVPSQASSADSANDAAQAEGEEEQRRVFAKMIAQRHYELSAEQGNAFSELRLGDYAYYGWGVRIHTGPENSGTQAGTPDGSMHASAPNEALEAMDDLDDAAESDNSKESMYSHGIRLLPQESDVGLSLARYRRTAAMRVTGEWMQPFVARASFNLGYIYHFGVGVPHDLSLARRYYHRCLELDPSGVQSPVLVMLTALALQNLALSLPSVRYIVSAFASDLRVHVLAMHVVAWSVLWGLRRSFVLAARQHQARATRDT